MSKLIRVCSFVFLLNIPGNQGGVWLGRLGNDLTEWVLTSGKFGANSGLMKCQGHACNSTSQGVVVDRISAMPAFPTIQPSKTGHW